MKSTKIERYSFHPVVKHIGKICSKAKAFTMSKPVP